jgi:hypothetical protein
MGEAQKSIDGIIEKLALVADGLETLFPTGSIAVALELSYHDYKKIQKNFRDVDNSFTQFKIDMSGVEFMFLMKDGLSTDAVNNS